MNDPRFWIRPCLPADQAAAYHVCLKTGDSGADGTHLYADDPEVLGAFFVGPYIHLEPEFAFVLEDAAGVCGYVLAALDSARFYARAEREWLPVMRTHYPDPAGDPATWTPGQQIRHLFHTFTPHYPATFQPYPSHLHIDLLPRAQGWGQGSRLMAHQMAGLAAQDSPGVHLGLSARNARALRFYQKLGFTTIDRTGPPEDEVLWMARRLP